jgi:DNA modification methylase
MSIFGIKNADSKQILKTLPSDWADVCFVNPPWWRIARYDGSLGTELTLDEYCQHLMEFFIEVKRVIKPSGCVWLTGNKIRKSNHLRYASPKPGIARTFSRVCDYLEKDGWTIQEEIVWHFSKGMTESFKQNDIAPNTHAYIGLLTKSNYCAFDPNKVHAKFKDTSVWTDDAPKVSKFYSISPKIAESCILATCPPRGIVLDIFAGSGTCGIICKTHGLNYLGIEIDQETAKIAQDRITD